LERVASSLASIDFEATPKACNEAVEAGISAKEIIGALSKGIDIVGKKFEGGEYFLSELIMAGEIFREAQEVVKPHIEKRDVESSGRVVIGTVRGDLHDIGKNIVVTLLKAEGFEVTDLGINTLPERFVDAVRRVKPAVLGLSALLRATVPEMGVVIKELEKEKLRNKVKVVVGGLPLNEEYAKGLGADYYAKDAWSGAEIVKKVVGAR